MGGHRVVVNTCYGGFNLSQEAKEMYARLTQGVERGSTWCVDMDVMRDDPHLLAVVDALGTEACSGPFSCLAIVEIPEDVGRERRWTVQEYDGQEWVAEIHRTWHAASCPRVAEHTCRG
jgi:hypothetical protein